MTCSTLRMPAPVARHTSATVWSRCRSTKCSSHSPGLARGCPGTSHSGRTSPASVADRRRRDGAVGSTGKPAAVAAAAPAVAPALRACARSEGRRPPLRRPLVRDRAVAARTPPATRRPRQSCPGAGCAGAPPGSSRRRPRARRHSMVSTGGDGVRRRRGSRRGPAPAGRSRRRPRPARRCVPASTRTPVAATSFGAGRQGGPGVEDGRDLDACGDEVLDHVVGAVVGRGDDDAAAGRHGVPVEVGADGTREHHAGHGRCRRRPADARGRRWRARPGRARMCQTAAGRRRRAGGVEVVGPVLDGEHVVVVVGAEGGGAGEHRDLRGRGELGRDVGDPRRRPGVPSTCSRARRQQRAAELGLVVDERRPGRRSGGGRGRGETRRAAADRPARRCARTSCRRSPCRARGRARRARRASVRRGRRPSERTVAVTDRLGAVAADLDQRVRLLDAGGHDAARTAAVDGVSRPRIRPLASRAEAMVSPG